MLLRPTLVPSLPPAHSPPMPLLRATRKALTRHSPCRKRFRRRLAMLTTRVTPPTQPTLAKTSRSAQPIRRECRTSHRKPCRPARRRPATMRNRRSQLGSPPQCHRVSRRAYKFRRSPPPSRIAHQRLSPRRPPRTGLKTQPAAQQRPKLHRFQPMAPPRSAPAQPRTRSAHLGSRKTALLPQPCTRFPARSHR